LDQDQALRVAPLLKSGDPIRRLNTPTTSRFRSPVIGLDALSYADRAVSVVILTDGLKDSLNLVAQRWVVLFDRHYIISALLSNLVGDLFLCVERIYGDG